MKTNEKRELWEYVVMIVGVLALIIFLSTAGKAQSYRCWEAPKLVSVIGGMQISKSEGFFRQSVRAGMTMNTPSGIMLQAGIAQYLQEGYTTSLSNTFQADVSVYTTLGSLKPYVAFGGNNIGMYVRPGVLYNVFGELSLEAYYLQKVFGFGFLIRFYK